VSLGGAEDWPQIRCVNGVSRVLFTRKRELETIRTEERLEFDKIRYHCDPSWNC
jgi:hypothetical protein